MNWSACKNILVIRPDNLGDLLMTSPAIRALKQTFNSRITVLTSPAAEPAAGLIPEIDETIVVNVPWVKSNKQMSSSELKKLTDSLSARNFDAAIIFTVYSQNPLPSAMLAWMSGIPKRLAYCRENPYDLVNYWIPDEEPYSYIRHQVERDLKLVNHVGAYTDVKDIIITIPEDVIQSTKEKLQEITGNATDFVILHAGVSELKRAYPVEKWVQLGKEIIKQFDLPVLYTGSVTEKPLTDRLQMETGYQSYSAGGLFSISGLAALISMSKLLVSVNTGPVHIAAGLKIPVIVLYAQTNPQHTPWGTDYKIFEFSVSSKTKSKNEVIRYVDNTIYKHRLPYPDVSQIIPSVQALLYKSEVQ